MGIAIAIGLFLIGVAAVVAVIAGLAWLVAHLAHLGFVAARAVLRRSLLAR